MKKSKIAIISVATLAVAAAGGFMYIKNVAP